MKKLLTLLLLLSLLPLQQSQAAVGTVKCKVQGGSWNGTGVLIEYEGRPVVITSGHQWKYGNTEGTWCGRKIELLEWDKEYDFAICSIEVEESIQRGKLSPDTLRDGQRLRILGTAGSGDSRQFQGVFGGFRRPMGGDPWDWFEIKGCAVRTGDSGGAVYADDGKVVGIVFGSSDSNYAGNQRVGLFGGWQQQSPCGPGGCPPQQQSPCGPGGCPPQMMQNQNQPQQRSLYSNAVGSWRILKALVRVKRLIFGKCFLLDAAQNRISPQTAPPVPQPSYQVQVRPLVPIKEEEPSGYPWYYVLFAPALFFLFCSVTVGTLVVANINQTRKVWKK
jgi:hypothetical protein